MRSVEKTAEIKDRMEAKWSEIEAVKAEREGLFQNEEENRDQIAALYFEKKILELQYLHLKRQQLMEVKLVENRPVLVESAEGVNEINETCIGLLQKSLVREGFKDRLVQEGLLQEEIA
ncbi:hypothetical protein [Paenibacillus humicus]|uniref:hypothetical protein n=1 Tax=Paenibacillus humicus TaxID=412861 RepID=UPI001C3F7BE6|nr:hypothetical protein [Paenibacillus humicus]